MIQQDAAITALMNFVSALTVELINKGVISDQEARELVQRTVDKAEAAGESRVDEQREMFRLMFPGSV